MNMIRTNLSLWSRRGFRSSTLPLWKIPFPTTIQKRFLETTRRRTNAKIVGTKLVRRMCGGCHKMLSIDAFSDKRLCLVGSTCNPHLPMCDVCRDTEQIVTSQQHLLDRQMSHFPAIFNVNDIQNPKMQGGFTYAAMGSYRQHSKMDNHQRCIIKWLKSGPVQSHDYYDTYMRRIIKAYDMIMTFNHEKIILEPVNIQIPSVVQLDSGEIVLQEPYIDEYEKWNSNSGWCNKSNDSWTLAFQALSHFSYHISEGLYVLCDLAGGLMGEGKAILTDAVVHSRSREFDAADLGTSGIYNFFAHHQCNEFCNPGWYTPIKHRKLYPPQPQTMLYDDLFNKDHALESANTC